jgi:hypothetical protein
VKVGDLVAGVVAPAYVEGGSGRALSAELVPMGSAGVKEIPVVWPITIPTCIHGGV